MAIRQRRGHNRWTEPQEFAASGNAVTISNGNLVISGNCISVSSGGRIDMYGDGLRMMSSSKIYSHNTNVRIIPNSGYFTKVGDAGSTSHGLNTNDDLFVTGTEEIDGPLHLDGNLNFAYTMGDSTADPTTAAPDDWVQVDIAGATYYLPAYLA